MTAALVKLHVDRLVLEGVSPRDRYRVASALEQELTRLFAIAGVPASVQRGGRAPSLDAGSFVVARGSPSDVKGVAVARALYTGLGGTIPRDWEGGS